MNQDDDSTTDCCRSNLSRWIITLIVCASFSLAVNIVILLLSTWSGPIYITFQVLCIVMIIALITVSSMTACCYQGRLNRAAAYASVAFLLLAVSTIIALSASATTSARYSCSLKMNCEKMIDAGQSGEHCNSANQRYTLCTYPKEKHSGGDLYYSRPQDDCEYGGGDDDQCRGFRSITDCVRYRWPDKDSDECSKSTSTIIDRFYAVAVSVSVFLFLTMIPAAGVAISVFVCSPNPRAEVVSYPLAQCIEIELGPRHAAPAFDGHIKPTASAESIGQPSSSNSMP